MSTQLTINQIIAGNKLIAEFDGMKVSEDKRAHLFSDEELRFPESLYYHSSWEWLMPVIEKISRIEFDREEIGLPFGGTQEIIHTYCPITFGKLNNETRNPMFRFYSCGLFEASTLIEAAWLAVVDFISNNGSFK